jgi:hypothetical protein
MAHVPSVRVFTGEAYYRWTDLVQVLCHSAPRPGARPPRAAAARLGRQVTSAAPHPGPHRPRVPPWGHRCRHADTAEGA